MFDIVPEAAFLLSIVEDSALIISLPAFRAAIERVKSAHHIVVGGTITGTSAGDFYGRFSKVIVFLQQIFWVPVLFAISVVTFFH